MRSKIMTAALHNAFAISRSWTPAHNPPAPWRIDFKDVMIILAIAFVSGYCTGVAVSAMSNGLSGTNSAGNHAAHQYVYGRYGHRW